MFLNDLKEDYNKLLKMEGMTQKEVCDIAGQYQNHLVRTIRAGKPSQNFIDLLDALGYDVRLEFVKRSDYDIRKRERNGLQAEK